MQKRLQVLRWRAYHVWLELKMIWIRRHRRIRFLFILQELSQWKTEKLYQAMLAHSRFEPILGITKCLGYPEAEQKVARYCQDKGYPYIWLDPQKTIAEQVAVDLLTHQKPYTNEINPAHFINANPRIPVVCIPYYLSTITEDWIANNRLTYLSWRHFCDNESCRKDWARISRVQGCNLVVTGLPVMDELLLPKDCYEDVWPMKDGRKRIIYAPHHTIADIHWEGIGYSTFLEYGEFMLEMRDKYKDLVFFEFKPHPRLLYNLILLWGKEKAEAYYEAWDSPGASHVSANEQYLSLFKHSDAMIHDCGSFTVEYLYTGNPVMYLVRDSHHKDNMTENAAKAFDLHYKGLSKEDIERFILSVIAGDDPRKEERSAFVRDHLQPPYGKSACTNIINAILGKEDFR